MRRIGSVALATATTAALALPIAGASAAQAASVPQAVPATAYHWEWSDGSYAERRTFTQRNYGTANNLPYFIVQASCADGARKGDVIKLQFRNSYGRYITEDYHVVDNCNGYGTFELNPYADSGRWAVGTYKYRIIVSGSGGMAAYFTITYARR